MPNQLVDFIKNLVGFSQNLNLNKPIIPELKQKFQTTSRKIAESKIRMENNKEFSQIVRNLLETVYVCLM